MFNLCRRHSRAESLDIVALEEKRKRVLAEIENEKVANPHAEQYRIKLLELLTSKTTSRDNFINWITGLTTGSLFFSLSNIHSSPDAPRLALISSALASLLGIISSISFKMALEARFFALELEVEILKTLYDGHDLRTQLSAELDRGNKISDADNQKFLRNVDQSLNLSDKKQIEKRTRSQNIKNRLMQIFFWSAIVLFSVGLLLLFLSTVL